MTIEPTPQDYIAAVVRQRDEALARLANAEAELAAARRLLDEIGRRDRGAPAVDTALAPAG